MIEELEAKISIAAEDLFGVETAVKLERTDEQFGDFASNIALQLAGQLSKSPREIAEQLANELKKLDLLSNVEVAGPGFINFTLKDEALWQLVKAKLAKPLAGQQILVEFGDPNPFKEMHIGHAYSYITGDAICSLLELAGAEVNRLSYHGDVGLHVAKAIWGMQMMGVNQTKVTDRAKASIGLYYAKGAQAYESDQRAKSEIGEINLHIYKRDDTEINELYNWGKEASLNGFDGILGDLSVPKSRRFFESDSAEKGLSLVKERVGTVFEESNGAIIYKGEKKGLHTRVFITAKGLPTYETKDLGLVELKKEAYPKATKSLIITAHEQSEYFKVMLAALSDFDPDAAKKTKHLSHGFVSLSSGKMSSRTGDVYSALSLIMDVEGAIKARFTENNDSIRNAAIKYGFLKHRLGSNIVYDIEESVALEGNSGPYLQYAHARACSILAKSSSQGRALLQGRALQEGERSLLRKIGGYAEMVDKATAELAPHHVCTYLYELAQQFNKFYETSRIIGDERQALRLKLVESYSQVLKSGLNLLGIEAPGRM